jgi:DNA-binding NarL/FixJ family response regulator
LWDHAVSSAEPADVVGSGALGSGIVEGGACVSVVLGGFEPLVSRGLLDLFREDRRLRVFCSIGGSFGRSYVAGSRLPRVAILSEASVVAGSLSSVAQDVGIVVLAREPTVAWGRLLLAAGVSCLDMGSSEESVVAAVQLAAAGGCLFVSGDGDRVEGGTSGGEVLVTDREIDVLMLLSEGASYRATALRLGISVPTVDKHVQRLLRKLGAASKRELVGLPVEWLSFVRTRAGLGRADRSRL